jgi:hypothetical protein
LLPRRKKSVFHATVVCSDRSPSATRTAWSVGCRRTKFTDAERQIERLRKAGGRDDPHIIMHVARLSPCESGWARNATPSSHTPEKTIRLIELPALTRPCGFKCRPTAQRAGWSAIRVSARGGQTDDKSVPQRQARARIVEIKQLARGSITTNARGASCGGHLAVKALDMLGMSYDPSPCHLRCALNEVLSRDDSMAASQYRRWKLRTSTTAASGERDLEILKSSALGSCNAERVSGPSCLE